MVDQVRVDSETERSVHNLPEEGGIEPSIEALNATLGVDLLGHVHEAGLATAFGAKLDAHLDHIHRLDAAGGSHSGEGSAGKVLVEVHYFKD